MEIFGWASGGLFHYIKQENRFDDLTKDPYCQNMRTKIFRPYLPTAKTGYGSECSISGLPYTTRVKYTAADH
jgi:hypothetical protein